MTNAKTINEAEVLSTAVDEVEMLNNELLTELALRTVRNVIAFRGVT